MRRIGQLFPAHSQARWSLILLFVLVWVVPGAVPARADDPKIETKFDITYAKVGDTELKLDLARPAEGDGPFPAVVAIHGGGWRAGNKSNMRPFLLELAKRGYVAISPQYRFAPQDRFPAQVHDVKASVRWLRSHASEYKVNPDKLGAMGVSAGGHLALMLGVTGPDDGLEGDVPKDAPSSRVQAVVNIVGPSDLLAKDLPEVSKGILKEFLGGTVEEKQAEATKASPLTYVSKDDPPVLTFQGTKDELVPYTQAVLLAEAQTKNGVPGRVEILVGAGHGFPKEEIERTSVRMFNFFDEHLKGAAPKP